MGVLDNTNTFSEITISFFYKSLLGHLTLTKIHSYMILKFMTMNKARLLVMLSIAAVLCFGTSQASRRKSASPELLSRLNPTKRFHDARQLMQHRNRTERRRMYVGSGGVTENGNTAT